MHPPARSRPRRRRGPRGGGDEPDQQRPKFTTDGGWVHCTLATFWGTARIEVADNGLGFPKPEQRDLFTRFFRSSTAQEHAIQGTGLGLTIVDSIVHNHGGDITVDSEHLDDSAFNVSLPLLKE